MVFALLIHSADTVFIARYFHGFGNANRLAIESLVLPRVLQSCSGPVTSNRLVTGVFRLTLDASQPPKVVLFRVLQGVFYTLLLEDHENRSLGFNCLALLGPQLCELFDNSVISSQPADLSRRVDAVNALVEAIMPSGVLQFLTRPHASILTKETRELQQQQALDYL